MVPAGASAAPDHGGTLTWLVTPEPASIVPLTTTAGGNAEIGPKVVEGLLTYDRNLNPKPLLATSWVVSTDGLQYRFNLRRGVKWHDGKPFTSADVAFSILTLKQVHPRGRSTFANDEGTDIAASPYNSAPVGTGPFVFKSFVHGSNIVLERNPDYWDKPKPYVDRIVVRFLPDGAARAAALESGAANLGDQAIPLSDVKRFSALSNFNVDTTNWAYNSNHQQLIFNLDTPVLKDKAVRKAISQALDVNALNRVVWYGYGQVSAAAIGTANAKYHNADIHYFPYDVAQANAALDAAGYKRGPDGKRFRLRLLYNPFQDPRAADFVRQSLARIGIDGEIESYDFATYVKRAYTDRAFDITLEALSNTFDPTVGVQRVFWSKNFKIGLPFSNAAHYSNPEVDRLLEAASVATDDAQRRQLFMQFQQIVHDDIPSIEFGANPNITISSRKVKNYAPGGEGIRGNFADLYIER
ncbi:MAG: ABC transporter substrate-binding protein [Burkholderia sp.]|nr:ABC transporter substrate-binding protein [Burkholderia sp.]